MKKTAAVLFVVLATFAVACSKQEEAPVEAPAPVEAAPAPVEAAPAAAAPASDAAAPASDAAPAAATTPAAQ